jgi:hypothetical protein
MNVEHKANPDFDHSTNQLEVSTTFVISFVMFAVTLFYRNRKFEKGITK